MICPECSQVIKHKYASTWGSDTLKCTYCSYVFAIDPKAMGFGDRRVLKVADKLSEGGQRYFTEQQLACACLLKRERSLQFMSIFPWFAAGFGVTFLIGGMMLSAMEDSPGMGLFIFALIMGLLCALIGISQKPTNKIWLGVQKYCQKKGHPFLITPTGAKAIIDRLLKKDKLSFEDFHPDKALIVDDVEFVALLLLNNFHRDSNCLVLDVNNVSGPFYDYFVKRQTSDEKLDVFAVHDGGNTEEVMVAQIKNNPKWIGCEEITDLGLTREALSNYKRGTWINELTGTVTNHNPKKIDEKYISNSVYPIDCIPPDKLNMSLRACMASGCVMLSPEMFAAIGTGSSHNSGGDGNNSYDSSSSGNSSYDSGAGGGAGFDDFG